MIKILVVDDEELVRLALRVTLENQGYQVRVAGHGEMALGLLDKGQFDVAIVDMVMPYQDGVETTIEIKRRYPSVKVIAISGGGRTRNLDFLKLAEEFGADAVLQKPITDEQVFKAVSACLAEVD